VALSLITEVLRSSYSFGMASQEELYWQQGQSSRKASDNHTARVAVPEKIRICPGKKKITCCTSLG